MVDGLLYVGSGVRVKYGFVKVYAVGAYVDKSDVADVIGKGVEEISEKICDPNTPKTIRIVMNRGLSVDKYMAAIMEALEPRMEGVDLDKVRGFGGNFWGAGVRSVWRCLLTPPPPPQPLAR
jgi:hypothetical protein